MSFLHKDLDLNEKKKIEKDVKKIVDSFGKTLESLGNLSKEGFIERDESFREETLEFPCDKNFKKRILDNAKDKDKDFIIVEKKTW